MWEMVKNETIIAVLEMLKDKRNTYKKIQEVTGASTGTIARIKQGKVKPNREAVLKQSENALKLVELEKENEELKEKVNSLERMLNFQKELNKALEKMNKEKDTSPKVEKDTSPKVNIRENLKKAIENVNKGNTSPKLEKNNLKKIDVFNKE